MSDDYPPNRRRSFLTASAGALAGLALAPGVRLVELSSARAPEEAASAKNRWGMLVDTSKCAEGCSACVSACAKENALQSHGRPRSDAQWIRKVELKDKQSGRTFAAPVLCQHCAQPPCVDVCPTGASFRRADGIVLVDRHICIGCRYCMMACPYKARSFVHEETTGQNPDVPRGKGCVEGCTFCVHRVDRGQTPACVEACAKDGGGALVFGDLNDPASAIAQRLASQPSAAIRGDLKLGTAVRYQGI